MNNPLPISLDTRHLFFEFLPSHSYLYNLYGNHPQTQLIGKQEFFWTNPIKQTEWFTQFNSLHVLPHIKSLFFLTLDHFLRPDVFETFYGWVSKFKKSRFAILHEVPEDITQLENLRKISEHVRIVCLLESIETELKSKNIINTAYLPHHPVHFQFPKYSKIELRKKYELANDQKIFTFLGEIREGKGLDVILESLNSIQESDRSKITFIIAGKSTLYSKISLEKKFQFHQIDAKINVLNNHRPSEYRAISDHDYMELIHISDAMLLPYHGRQSKVMSGILPDAVYAGVPIISSKASHIGRLVEENELGLTFNVGSNQSFGQIVSEVIRNGIELGSNSQNYMNSIKPESVINKLNNILNS